MPDKILDRITLERRMANETQARNATETQTTEAIKGIELRLKALELKSKEMSDKWGWNSAPTA